MQKKEFYCSAQALRSMFALKTATWGSYIVAMELITEYIKRVASIKSRDAISISTKIQVSITGLLNRHWVSVYEEIRGSICGILFALS